VVVRICIAGVLGWTAPPIRDAIDAADDLTLAAEVSRSAAHKKPSTARHPAATATSMAIVAGPLAFADVDVLVTTPARRRSRTTAGRSCVQACTRSSARAG
jgi:4-hydroxy-tetrahydrodipicolinate reductase